jgi:hypothetical protein
MTRKGSGEVFDFPDRVHFPPPRPEAWSQWLGAKLLSALMPSDFMSCQQTEIVQP